MYRVGLVLWSGLVLQTGSCTQPPPETATREPDICTGAQRLPVTVAPVADMPTGAHLVPTERGAIAFWGRQVASWDGIGEVQTGRVGAPGWGVEPDAGAGWSSAGGGFVDAAFADGGFRGVLDTRNLPTPGTPTMPAFPVWWSDRGVRWSGSELGRLCEVLRAHPEGIVGTWSDDPRCPDGAGLAWVGWDGELRRTFAVPEATRARVAFDGSYIVRVDRDSSDVLVARTDGPTRWAPIPSARGLPADLAGGRLLLLQRGGPRWRLHVVDVPRGRVHRTIETAAGAIARLSADGRQLLLATSPAAHEATIEVQDTDTGRVRVRHHEDRCYHVRDAVMSGDGSRAIVLCDHLLVGLPLDPAPRPDEPRTFAAPQDGWVPVDEILDAWLDVDIGAVDHPIDIDREVRLRPAGSGSDDLVLPVGPSGRLETRLRPGRYEVAVRMEGREIWRRTLAVATTAQIVVTEGTRRVVVSAAGSDPTERRRWIHSRERVPAGTIVHRPSGPWVPPSAPSGDVAYAVAEPFWLERPDETIALGFGSVPVDDARVHPVVVRWDDGSPVARARLGERGSDGQRWTDDAGRAFLIAPVADAVAIRPHLSLPVDPERESEPFNPVGDCAIDWRSSHTDCTLPSGALIFEGDLVPGRLRVWSPGDPGWRIAYDQRGLWVERVGRASDRGALLEGQPLILRFAQPGAWTVTANVRGVGQYEQTVQVLAGERTVVRLGSADEQVRRATPW